MVFPRRLTRQALPYILAGALYVAAAVWVTVHATALDYAVYLIGAQGFISGQDVYQWGRAEFLAIAERMQIPHFTSPYRYSPITALLIAPLLVFPYRTGLLIWSLVNAAAVIATGELLSRLSARPAKRWAIRCATWLFFPFFVSLYAGQVNPLTVLFAALALLAFRNGRDCEAGWWTAVAFLIKPIAVGLICYPIWKGRWRAIATFAAVTVVSLLLMTALFGWGSMRSGLALSIAGARGGAYPPLQNLWGTTQRWFTIHEYGGALAGNPLLSIYAGLLLCLSLAIATLLLCGLPLRSNSWRDTDLGLVITAIALMAPVTWYHHYALLVLPLAILIAYAETRVDMIFVLGSWLAINFFGMVWHALVGHTLLLDMGTAGALTLWFGLARISRPKPG